MRTYEDISELQAKKGEHEMDALCIEGRIGTVLDVGQNS